MAAPGVCPTGATETFPNALALGSTNAEFFAAEGTYEPTNIEFQWADQRTPPAFINSTSGIIAPAAGLSNTLRYKGTSYTLRQLQIIDKSHTTWILPPSAVANNKEDILFTFVAESGAQIIIVVPILRSPTLTQTDPNYFKAMGPIGTYDFSNPVSLSDFFPPTKTTTVLTNTMHLYYTICAQGQDITVIVQVYGLRVSDAVMNIVKTAYNSTSDSYGTYDPIPGVSFSSFAGSFDEAAFKTKIKYAFNLGETIAQSAPTPVSTEQVESVDAYKCVPFDPDTQVVDGKIRFNSATGELYSKVEGDRAVLKEEAKTPSALLLSAEQFVKNATASIGIFFATIVFLILIYLLVWGGGGMGAEESTGGFQRFLLGLKGIFENQMLTTILFCSMFAFIGFIIGMTLR